MVFFISSVSLLIFCLLVLLITERSVEVSNYNYGVVCFFFQSVRFCFMYSEALFLGAYTLRIVMSSWWVSPPIIMWDLSLSLPGNFLCFEVYFVWKSIFYLDQCFHSISFSILLLLTYLYHIWSEFLVGSIYLGPVFCFIFSSSLTICAS